jgi:hypothetical protein
MSLRAYRCESAPSPAKRLLACAVVTLMTLGAPGAAYADTLPWMKQSASLPWQPPAELPWLHDGSVPVADAVAEEVSEEVVAAAEEVPVEVVFQAESVPSFAVEVMPEEVAAQDAAAIAAETPVEAIAEALPAGSPENSVASLEEATTIPVSEVAAFDDQADAGNVTDVTETASAELSTDVSEEKAKNDDAAAPADESAELLPPVQTHSHGKDEKFDEVASVDDADLATMRGGFMNINGVLFDFSFLTRISVNNAIRNEITFDSATQNLVQKVGQVTSLNQALQPIIIQNQLSEQLIQATTNLNLTVQGAVNAALQHNVQQASDFSNIISLR